MGRRRESGYRDPCSEDREIGAIERNLILGAIVSFQRIGRRWGRCDPDRCRNTTRYRFEIGGKTETIEGCPHRFITDRTRHYLDAFGHYRAGFLEQAGGIMDQAEEYLTAMRIIGNVFAEMEVKDPDRPRTEGNRGHR